MIRAAASSSPFRSLIPFVAFVLAACSSPTHPDGGDAARDGVLADGSDIVGSDSVDAPTDLGAETGQDVVDVSADVVVCDGATCGSSCVDLQTDPTHCGSCSNDCTALPGVNVANVRCVAGVCDLGGACRAGRAHCTTNAADGCETDLSQPTHCGACTTTCADPTPMCTADSSGTYSCASGCSGSTPSHCGTQCVDLQTNPDYCGSCATGCTVGAHAMRTCTAGSCGGTCDTGFANCDDDFANGCEIDTQSDAMHCGACATVCTVGAHATAACTTGTCGGTCDPSFANCDNDFGNGCEIDTQTNVMNCGSCGNACPVGPHATATCASATCGITCDPGYADCDNDPSNGCEIHLDADPAHCGTCTTMCLIPNGAPACVAGTCTVATCMAGFADCDNNPATGCERNTMADPTACGGCGTMCAIPNGTPACVAGMCAVGTCNAGFTDCDGVVANGCETPTANDVNNCGTCGHVCNVPNAVAACTGGVCTIAACNSGFADCRNGANDGCEVNTRNDPGNCGSCNAQCFAANGTAGCAAGTCTVASCNSGFGNCNGLAADGCETNLMTSASSCGTCGNNCAAACSGNVLATTCAAGTCQITSCAPGRFNVDGTCSNGCECTTTGTSSACGSPSSLGSLNIGQTAVYSGNLVPAGQEAYLSVTFTGNTNTSYHPRVTLTAGASEFAFDIVANCTGAALTCGVEGGNSINRTQWEVAYTGGDPANPPNFNPIPPVGTSGTVIIHVYRRAGQPVTCNSYTLTVSN